MFKKILIANRGEIALRVIRACKELGIKTVAVYSKADAESLHVRFADESVCIGPPENSKSYLNETNIISACEITDAEAVHPGYGFLAENARFAEMCEECNITFIGPPPEIIRLMGDKVSARQIAKRAGLPILPGSSDSVKDLKEALDVAKSIGFPIILKASAGGGGRGMRVVFSEDALANSFMMARSESISSFGSPDIYVEKFLEKPRHIEFQVIGDQKGNVYHLGERECSIQRRHQKLLEESPSPAVTEKVREKMGNLVVAAMREIKYSSVGTVEFLMDQEGNFYFIEMNTRIQVEHPVTEMVTGIDLIKEQIRIAAGHELKYRPKDIRLTGHSIECRINAEDPQNFTPNPGKITAFNLPGGPGVRVDTAAYNEYQVTPFYDSLIAKLIVHARDRAEAIARMERALDEFIVEGIKTTIPLHKKLMRDPSFRQGRYHIEFLNELLGKS
jgi:acetyl-CoA carboxylase biotin carboxylase subunit